MRRSPSELAWWANCLGLTGAPFDSYLTLRGMRTLHAAHARSTWRTRAAVVDAAGRAPGGASASTIRASRLIPGTPSPRAAAAGFGAMVSFELAGGARGGRAFVDGLRCFTLAESLGGVESLVAHPATMTHASMDAEARRRPASATRCCGCPSASRREDLVADLVRGLAAVEDAA